MLKIVEYHNQMTRTVRTEVKTGDLFVKVLDFVFEVHPN
jgi:hypothetical protein